MHPLAKFVAIFAIAAIRTQTRIDSPRSFGGVTYWHINAETSIQLRLRIASAEYRKIEIEIEIRMEMEMCAAGSAFWPFLRI